MQEIKNTITDIAQGVVDGNTDAIKAYIQLHELSKHLESCLKMVKDYAIDEADKHPGKTFKMEGWEITKKSDPGRWDFSGLLDIEKIKNSLKDREELHKQAYHMKLKGQEITDTETGEVIEAASYTEGKSNISLKPVK